jgi:hypothetical protein
MEHGLAVFSELARGLLRFGLDRLGGAASDEGASGGLPLEACHPYGFRSRPRDADVDADGNPTRGAGLLVIERGGGDDGAIPTQDPRVELPDEGKGGAQVYAWTGSGVSYVLVAGSGNITISVGGGTILLDGTSQIGGAGGAPIARATELQAWAATVDASIAAIVSAASTGALAAPIVLPPTTPLSPAVAATKGTVV